MMTLQGAKLQDCRDVLHWLPYPQRILYRISALVRRCILSPGTLLLYCYYSASYLITLFCPGGVAGPPNAACYVVGPHPMWLVHSLCGWSDGLDRWRCV